MARKVQTVTIQSEGRDKGKVFLLTEMDAFKAEHWANRAAFAVFRAGGDIGREDWEELRAVDWDEDRARRQGMILLAMLGMKLFSGINPDVIKPLLDEMLDCIQRIPDPKVPDVARKLFPEDIEEPKTIYQLRAEIIALHTGFSMTGVLSTISKTVKETTSPGSSITSTSPTSSEPSSPPS